MTTRLRLTDAQASRAKLPDGKDDHVIWDADVPSFGLRLRPIGKSWILAYRPGGAGRSAHRKRMKLGAPNSLSAGDARTLARIALGKIAAGADPLGARKAEKRRGRSVLGDLLNRYELDLERRRYVNYKTHTNGLRTKLKPLLGREAAEITGAELAEIIERYEKAGRPGAGRDFRARCRAFFSWIMVKAKVIGVNPLAGFRRERATRADKVEEAQHGRALTDKELVAVWRGADPTTNFGRLLRFYLLTGCRRGEGAGLSGRLA